MTCNGKHPLILPARFTARRTSRGVKIKIKVSSRREPGRWTHTGLCREYDNAVVRRYTAATISSLVTTAHRWWPTKYTHTYWRPCIYATVSVLQRGRSKSETRGIAASSSRPWRQRVSGGIWSRHFGHCKINYTPKITRFSGKDHSHWCSI